MIEIRLISTFSCVSILLVCFFSQILTGWTKHPQICLIISADFLLRLLIYPYWIVNIAFVSATSTMWLLLIYTHRSHILNLTHKKPPEKTGWLKTLYR